MAQHDLRRAQALGLRRADVVGVHRLQHRRPREAAERGEADQHHRERRQDLVAEVVDHPLPERALEVGRLRADRGDRARRRPRRQEAVGDDQRADERTQPAGSPRWQRADRCRRVRARRDDGDPERQQRDDRQLRPARVVEPAVEHEGDDRARRLHRSPPAAARAGSRHRRRGACRSAAAQAAPRTRTIGDRPGFSSQPLASRTSRRPAEATVATSAGDESPSSRSADDVGPEQPACASDEQHKADAADRRLLEPVVELDGAELLQQHGEPEDRQREEQEGGERGGVVEAAVLADRRQDADGDADAARR